MLTRDLLLTRAYKGEIRPRYIDEDEAHLALAEQLIEVFDAHLGRSRQELETELKDLLGTGTSFLLHRGLAKLLRDRCEFKIEAPLPPEDLRREVFDTAARAYGQPQGEDSSEPFRFDRRRLLEQAAVALGLKPEDCEENLYADLKDQQILQSWKPCKPPWLLRRYNVALAQGVLLRANELTLHLAPGQPRKHRELFRKIKFFQLMHRVKRMPDGAYRIRLDGPMSLFQASQRYGLQMASFLPTLMHFADWRLEAELRWGKRRLKRRFLLTPKTGLVPYGKLLGQWQPPEVAWLPEQFAALDSEWEINTNAELIDLGGEGILVPDFVFQHRPSGTTAYMEVLGFWRKGAVESRLRLLRRHGPQNLILALGKKLAGDKESLADLPGEVYLFASSLVARKVLKHLERIRSA